MDGIRIPFISSYCDRWCERCRFTERCSTYACEIAVAMCGDVEAGIELALGAPRAVAGTSGNSNAGDIDLDRGDASLSPQEQAEYDRREDARDARIDESPITTLSAVYRTLCLDWLKAHGDAAGEDPLVAEARAVIEHDAFSIGAKLHRALDGLDRSEQGEDEDQHPVQNDWNGSAKVAMISLERSEAAWRAMAAATRDPEAAVLAEALRDLQLLVRDRFPRAMSFIRPGFDEPWR